MFRMLSSYWGSNSGDDEIDPATGLTGKQKRLVTETWGIIRQDPLNSGMAVMMHFFRSHPDYQQMFQGFKDVSLEELPKNPKFHAHSTAVVNALSAVVDSLDNPSVLVDTLVSLGERHKKRGQTKEQFLNLKMTVLAVFEQALGAKWTQEVSNAWNQTLLSAYSLVFKAYDE